jgi:hypothetical protein
VRARHQDQSGDIEDGAGDHHRTKAITHRPGAGDRLQKSPGEVLHGNRQRKLGNRDADVMGQRLHENAERLPEPHAQRQHQRGADQDG